MDTSTTRVYPKKVFVPERFYRELATHLKRITLTSQAVIQDFDRRGDEPPTPLADLLVRAACSNLVIVRHIDIKDQLSPLRLQCSSSKGLPITWLLLSSIRAGMSQAILTRAEYCGPISKRLGLRRISSFLKSSAAWKELYRM
jgi:hypothetical protein